jgi:hypothetical protein
MRYITFIACTFFIAFSLTAFINSNWNDTKTNNVCSAPNELIDPPTFFYDLSSGNKNIVTKERMHNAKTVADLFPDFQMQEDVKNKSSVLRDVKISVGAPHGHCSMGSFTIEDGNSFTDEHVKLLQSADYGTNFNLEGYTVPNIVVPDLNKKRYFNYSMTVVPENQATYRVGNEALINFLSTKCQSTIDKVERGHLKSGNISFTVTKEGSLSNIELQSTCGYPSVDGRMMDLMDRLPTVWNVATDSNGEKIEQTLVFSYGVGGC